MIFLIHGDDQYLSRKKCSELIDDFRRKKPSPKILRFVKAENSLQDIASLTDQADLFSDQKIIVFEDFLSLKSSKDFEKLLELIKAFSLENEVIFWQSKQLQAPTINKIKATGETRVFSFPVKKIIFSFLDEIKTHNSYRLLSLLSKILKDNPIELVLYLLKNHLRQLILVEDEDVAAKLKLPSWRINKLKNQSKNFSFDLLKKFYLSIIELEYKERSGANNVPQEIALEMSILKHLQ